MPFGGLVGSNSIFKSIEMISNIPSGIATVANLAFGNNDKKSSNSFTSGMGGIQQREANYRDKMDKSLRHAAELSTIAGAKEGMKRIYTAPKIQNISMSNYARVFQQVMKRNPDAATRIKQAGKGTVKPIKDDDVISPTETATMLKSKVFKGMS